MLTRFQTKLGKKIQLTDDMYLLRFDLIEPKEINFLAGQYVISLIPQGQPGQFLRRLYSIASSPNNKNNFELLIKNIPNGTGSIYLTSLNEEDKVLFDGPAGIFTLKENDNKKIFLATGTGLAPIRSMLQTIAQQFKVKSQEYYLFWGLANFKDICLLDELKNWQRKLLNFQFFLCLSRESSLDKISGEDKKFYHLGRIPTAFDKYWEKIKDGEFNICGNRDVVESLKTYLFEKVQDKTKIYFEKF